MPLMFSSAPRVRLKLLAKAQQAGTWLATSARSSKNPSESRWLAGAYTLVRANSKSEAVEVKKIVSVCCRLTNEVMLSVLGFHAVSKPPRAPFASTQEKSESWGKERASFCRVSAAQLRFLDTSNIKAHRDKGVPDGFALIRISKTSNIPRDDQEGNRVSIH